MRAQTRLRAPPSHSTERSQHPGCAQHSDTRRSRRDERRQTVQYHGDVVEHVCGEPVGLAFWFEGGADAVREEDCRDAPGAVLEDVKEKGGCWGGGCVANADAWIVISGQWTGIWRVGGRTL